MTKSKKKNSRASSGQKTACITCKGEVTTDAIQCNSCDLWAHIGQACSGLPEKLAAEILNHDCDAVQYICNKCRSKPKSPKTDNAVLNSLSQINTTLEGIAVGLAELQSWRVEMTEWRSQMMQQQVSQGRTSPPHLVSGDMHAIIRSELTELRERDKRRETIIVKGIDSRTETEFIEKFNSITEILIDKRLDPTEITRINSKIVRLKILNKHDRLKLLTSSSQLKHLKDFAHVYISKDLTYKQRTELLDRRRTARAQPRDSVATGANSIPLNSPASPPRSQTVNSLRQSESVPLHSGSLATRPPDPPASAPSTPFRTTLNLISSPAGLRELNTLNRSPGSPNGSQTRSPNTQGADLSGAITED